MSEEERKGKKGEEKRVGEERKGKEIRKVERKGEKSIGEERRGEERRRLQTSPPLMGGLGLKTGSFPKSMGLGSV